MATFLHDLSTLETLADGPSGPARDWANVRLSLRDPARVLHLPEHPGEASFVITSGAPRAIAEIREQLASGGTYAARHLETLSGMGLLPLAEPEPWTTLLRERWSEGNEYLCMVASEVLADLGIFDDALVARVAKSETGHARASASALMLRWAAHRGQSITQLVPAIAHGLLALVAEHPDTLVDVFGRLGLPFLSEGIALDEAASLGAALAGGTAPPLREAHGSTRAKARRYVRQLLDGREGPAELLLLALADLEVPAPADLVTLAAWCARREPRDPLQDVLRGAGEDRTLLAQARAQITPEHARSLLEHGMAPELSGDPVLALVPALGALGRAELVQTAALRDTVEFRLTVMEDQRAKLVLPFTTSIDTLPEALREEDGFGLVHAAYANTEEVLETLLGLEATSRDARKALGLALAEQADPAAFARLQKLAHGDRDLETAVHRGALLLGRTS